METSRRSGVTMSTFSLAIGRSLLKAEPPRPWLDGLEFHLVPVVHPGLLARDAEDALEPDEAPVQLSQLPVAALREQLGELALLDDGSEPIVEHRHHHRS